MASSRNSPDDFDEIVNRLSRLRLSGENVIDQSNTQEGRSSSNVTNDNRRPLVEQRTWDNSNTNTNTITSNNSINNFRSYYTQPVGPRNSTNHGTDDNYETNEISGQMTRRTIAKGALTFQGSQFLQNVLKQTNSPYLDTIFVVVLEHMFAFLTNEFGNHVFLRLVERCNDTQLRLIVNRLTMDTELFVIIIQDKFCVNSVKRLIKVLNNSLLVDAITAILVSNIKKLMKIRISSRVIIKCLECLDVHQNKELFESIIFNCLDLATDDKGCLALNEAIKHFKQPYREILLQKISSEARFLSQDPSGNYTVREVLKLCHPEYTEKICKLLNGYFVSFSTQKSSSHVVEMCLRSEIGINFVLNEFLNYDKLWKIASDQCGNYVIQTALNNAKGSERYEEFVDKLYKARNYFQSGYGKNAYNLIMKLRGCKC